jgi:hypothetical protein
MNYFYQSKVIGTEKAISKYFSQIDADINADYRRCIKPYFNSLRISAY